MHLEEGTLAPDERFISHITQWKQKGYQYSPSSYSSKQVTVRIIIIPFTYPIHPFQKEEEYSSHISSRNP
jgi:hypothetical protein